MADAVPESRDDPADGGSNLLPYATDPPTRIALLVLAATCVLAAVLHAMWPQAVDQTSAIFLALAAAVLVLPQVTRIRLPGGTVIEKIAAQQRALKDRVEEQQKVINKLVETSMSASVFHHLAGVYLLETYEYLQDKRIGELFRREFYFLKNRGFIGPETLEFDERLHKQNVAKLAKPTEIGERYIELRKADIPKDWLSPDPDKRKNLRIDVARKLGLEIPEVAGS
jgi:hypothetical protein